MKPFGLLLTLIIFVNVVHAKKEAVQPSCESTLNSKEIIYSISHGLMRMDPVNYAVSWSHSAPLFLSPTEYEILEDLVLSKGAVRTHDEIFYEHLEKNDREHSTLPHRLVAKHITVIKNKLEQINVPRDQIGTRKGEGYFWRNGIDQHDVVGSLSRDLSGNYFWNEQYVHLTKFQIFLLNLFFEKPKKLFDRESVTYLVAQVFPDKTWETLSVQLSQMNKAFEKVGGPPRVIRRYSADELGLESPKYGLITSNAVVKPPSIDLTSTGVPETIYSYTFYMAPRYEWPLRGSSDSAFSRETLPLDPIPNENIYYLIEFEDIRLDPDSRSISWQGSPPLILSESNYTTLEGLVLAEGKVKTYVEIFMEIKKFFRKKFASSQELTRVQAQIRQLRQELAKIGVPADQIQIRHGAGYFWKTRDLN